MKKLWKLKITPYKSGKIAELLCRMYMRLLGYSIIAKNHITGSGKKTFCGEIDFIAKKKNKIIFCEVKKRKNKNEIFRALSPKQQKRIINGAMSFIKNNKKYRNCIIQFDVFFVILPFKIKRIKNAFRCDNI